VPLTTDSDTDSRRPTQTPPSDPFDIRLHRIFGTLSAVQKDIRRGNEAEAELNTLALYLFNPKTAWSHILNASTEETSDPLTIVAVDVLHRQHEELVAKGEKNLGKLARLAMLAAGLLAKAPKDRIADEMLHLTDFCDLLAGQPKLDKWYRDLNIGADIDRLLVEGVVSPELQSVFLELLQRDFVMDLHTNASLIKGRRRNTVRGESHWDEEASKCVNRTPEYETWRTTVYDVIRRWALSQLQDRERQ
jgi:hypothetical protein